MFNPKSTVMKPVNVYSNKEISVSFDAKRCINSQLCAKGLSSVVRNSVLPWNNNDDENQRIIKQVRKCPSGVLKVTLKKQMAKAV